ncbi:MAG: GNAT family N-acetyltransferase [Clostridiales bacterium]|nr:GNAT family N-acetyltransferase [Clostridiales bacterium]
MISESAFADYKARASECKYSSLKYVAFEDCRTADELRNTGGNIVLCDECQSPVMLYFAANDFEQVINEADKIEKPLRINFVPHGYKQKLMQNGFEIWGEYVDYVNPCLKKAAVTPYAPDDLDYLEQSECEQVSLMSKRCAGLSRGFIGEQPGWFSKWMDDGNSVILIKDQKRMAGFCCVSIYAEGTTLWIREVAVDPAYQGRGYGRKLMEQAVGFGIAKGATKGFLAVDVMNHRAISIYEKFGFAPGNDEGELQMVRC